MKSKTLFLLVLLITGLIISSGCINNGDNTPDEQDHQTNTMQEEHQELNTTQEQNNQNETNNTGQEQPPEKIKKVVLDNQYLRVYYIGYDEEIASYSWKIDGTIISGEQHHIILSIENKPKSVSFTQYKSNKYLTEFETFETIPSEENKVIVKFSPTTSLNTRAVIVILREGKKDGYFVILPKEKSIDLAHPEVKKVKLLNLEEIDNGYEFGALISIQLTDNQIPTFVVPTIQLEQEDIYIQEMNSKVYGNIMNVKIKGLISNTDLSEDDITIKILYTLSGEEILTTNTLPVKELVNLLNEKIKEGGEEDNDKSLILGDVSYKVLGLYTLNKNIDPEALNILKEYNNENSDNDVDEIIKMSEEYNYLLDIQIQTTLHPSDTISLFSIQVYSDGNLVNQADIIPTSNVENIYSIHLTVPTKTTKPNIELKLYILEAPYGDLEPIKTITINNIDLPPTTLGTFTFTQVDDKTIVDYQPNIPEEKIIRMSQYFEEVNQTIKIEGYDDLSEAIQELVAKDGFIKLQIGDKVYYIDDMNTLLRVLLDNDEEQVKISNKNIIIKDKNKIEEILTETEGKYFLWDSTKQDELSQMFGADLSQADGIVIPLGIGPNNNQSLFPVMFIADEDSSENAQYINLLMFLIGVIPDATQPARLVFIGTPITPKPGDYPIITFGQINLFSVPTLVIDSSSYNNIYSLILGYGVTKLTVEEQSLTEYTLPLSSGDSIVGDYNIVTSDGTTSMKILNIDLTQHYGYTPDQIYDVMSEFGYTIGESIAVFISEDNHLMLQVAVTPYNDYITLPNKDEKININELPQSKIVDYNYTTQENKLDIQLQTSKQINYKLILSLTFFNPPRDITENDFIIKINGETTPGKVHTQVFNSYGVVGIIIDADQTTQTIHLEINPELINNLQMTSILPVLTNTPSPDIITMLTNPLGVAVIGDYTYITGEWS